MKKHLVVVVHGVGEQAPGETLDAFVGAAREELALSAPVVNHTVKIPEQKTSGETPVNADGQTVSDTMDLYDCNIRTVQQTPDCELTFAEVYWADLSSAPKGVLATIASLFQLVMGLGYVALNNIENNATFRKGAWVPFMVGLFVWVFYGLVAPMNLLLFGGSFMMLADQFAASFKDFPYLPVLLVASFSAIAGGVSLFVLRTVETYMLRCILRGTAVLGLLGAVAVTLVGLSPNLMSKLTWIKGCDGTTSAAYLRGIDCFTGVAVLALNAVWFFEVVLLVALAVASAWGVFKNLGNKRSIYLAICATMLLLWMTFTVAFWTFFKNTVSQLVGQEVEAESAINKTPLATLMDTHFDSATHTLPYGVLGLILLVFCAWVVSLVRSSKSRTFALNPGDPSWDDKWYGRLILNPFLNFALFVASGILIFGVAYAFAEFVVTDNPGCTENKQAALFRFPACIDTLFDRFGPIALGIVGLIGVLVVNNAKFVANILGIARDVVVYLTRSHRANPLEDASGSRFPIRERIEARFSRTLESLLKGENQTNIEKITVVAHSQGTVVAVRALEAMAGNLKPVTLVTMASPLTHLFGNYFKADFALKSSAVEGLEAWHNIYRQDDFVGTWIDSDDAGVNAMVSNQHVPPGGHINYWIDRSVWDVLNQKELFKPL